MRPGFLAALMFKAPPPISNGVASCRKGVEPPDSCSDRRDRPCLSWTSAVVIMAEERAAGLHVGYFSLSSAESPATWGVAILVPEIIANC